MDKAGEDLHQRTFARAIFTQDALNRAGRDRKRDVIVRVIFAEVFVDAAQFNLHRLYIIDFFEEGKISLIDKKCGKA